MSSPAADGRGHARADDRRRPSTRRSPRSCAATRRCSSSARTSPRRARRSRCSPGLVEEFGPERVIDSPISEAGIAGLGARRRDDRDAARRRHHVRRLPDADHGPGRQPGREDPLHVGRQPEGAADDPDDARRDAPLGRAALAEPARVGRARPRPQGLPAVDARRREGAAQVGDPRRQPGRSSSRTR